MALNVGELTASLKLDSAGFTQGLKQAESKLASTSQAMSNAGGTLTRGLTLPLVGAAAGAIKLADDFELEMSRIQGLVGATGAEVRNMREDVLTLAGDTGKAPAELAEAMFSIQSAGIKGAAATEALTIAAKAGTAGLGATRDVALAAASSMNAYGESNLSAIRATDILTATVKEGNLAADELASAIGKVIPVSAAANVGLDEVGAAIALITRNGANAAEATTQLRAMLLSLNSPTQEVVRVFQEAGISTEDLRRTLAEDGLIAALRMVEQAADGDATVMRRLLGSSEALSGALTLLNGDAATTAAVFENVANSAGITQSAFDVASQTSAVQFQQALANMKAALIDLGAMLSPILTAVTNAIGDFVGIISNLSEGEKKLLLVMGGIVAAAGPMMKLIGSVGGAMARMATQATTASVATAGLNVAMLGIGAIALVGMKAFFDYKKRQREFEEQLVRTNQVLVEFNDTGAVTTATVKSMVDALPEATEGVEDLGSAFSESAADVLFLEEAADRGLRPTLARASQAGYDFAQMARLTGSELNDVERALRLVTDGSTNLETAVQGLSGEALNVAVSLGRAHETGGLTEEQFFDLVDATFAVEEQLRSAREANEEFNKGVFESGQAQDILQQQLGFTEAAAEALYLQLMDDAAMTSFTDSAGKLEKILEEQEFAAALATAEFADYREQIDDTTPAVDDLTQSIEDMVGAFVSMIELSFDAQDMIDSLGDKVDDLSQGFDDNTIAGRENIRTVNRFSMELAEMRQGLIDQGHDAAVAREETRKLALEYLDAAAAAGLNVDAIEELLVGAQMLNDGDYSLHLELGPINEFLDSLGEAQGILNGLNNSTVTIKFASDSRGFQIPTKAIGGINFPLRTGGPVPGPRDQPFPITAHGGEFVLSADVVDAIKRGGKTLGLGGGQAQMASVSGGGSINVTVNAGMGADGRLLGEQIVDEIRKFERANGDWWRRTYP